MVDWEDFDDAPPLPKPEVGRLSSREPNLANWPQQIVDEAPGGEQPPESGDPPFEIPEEARPALERPTGFLTGEAGTGKTFMVREMAEHREGVVLAATTGIAAVNLGTTTINSLLGYFDTNSLKDNYVAGYVTARLKRLYEEEGLRHLVIDEVSMMDGEQLKIIVQALAEANDWLTGKDRDAVDEGVAPIKLTLTGDFCQLPPVKAKFAFEVPEWQDHFAQNIARLTRVRRQADRWFIEALQHARRGQGVRAAEILAPRFVEGLDYHFDGTTIFAKNEEVERFNKIRLDELITPVHEYRSERWGTQKGEWKNIPETLVMKPGALVMVLANRRERKGPGEKRDYLYVNGDLGTYEGVTEHPGSETPEPVVKLQRSGRRVIVERAERAAWATLDSVTEKELKEAHPEDWGRYISKNGEMYKTGAVQYVPLRLAWGTTVHKSQGLSLDTVQVNLRDGFFNAAGMCYVALSRGRTMEGLRLVGQPRILVDKCRVDRRVMPWI